MRSGLALALVLATALGSSPAWAKPAAPAAPPPADVEVAEQLYAKLDYDKANDVATRVLKKNALTHDQLVRATKILAITDAILDKDDDAKDAFLNVLIFDPEYTVDPNLGPKVSGPFLEARGHYRALTAKPGIEVTPQLRSDGGQLRVVTRDPTHIAKKVNVGWRWTSSGDYTTQTIAAGEATVEVAAAPTGRTRLDFYAQALDDHDNAVFEAGSAAVPKSAFAEAGPKPPVTGGPAGKTDEKKSGGILANPIFWIITGAVVAGGATGAFFLFKKDATPTSAALTPQIRCGPDLCK
jgi:hypothetical protein